MLPLKTPRRHKWPCRPSYSSNQGGTRQGKSHAQAPVPLDGAAAPCLAGAVCAAAEPLVLPSAVCTGAEPLVSGQLCGQAHACLPTSHYFMQSTVFCRSPPRQVAAQHTAPHSFQKHLQQPAGQARACDLDPPSLSYAGGSSARTFCHVCPPLTCVSPGDSPHQPQGCPHRGDTCHAEPRGFAWDPGIAGTRQALVHMRPLRAGWDPRAGPATPC